MGEQTALPAGTVTLLFSDIEGSTQLMRDLGERWGEALGAHRRLVREACGRPGGREVDTQGDAFFFAFPRARDALVAAADAQRALAAHEWPDGSRLRVRMGIHTGEPAVGAEGYLGLDVVRAARLCSAAHGGQVLVSETTRALVGAGEPDGIALRELGEHQLKDMAGPEQIYELAIDGLEERFPPIRTGEGGLPAAQPPMELEGLDARVAAATREFGSTIEREVAGSLRAAGIPDLTATGLLRSDALPERIEPAQPAGPRLRPWIVAAVGVLLVLAVAWIILQAL